MFVHLEYKNLFTWFREITFFVFRFYGVVPTVIKNHIEKYIILVGRGALYKV